MHDELATVAPPWSSEAEQSLLGALMADSDAFLRIADRRVIAAHFFDQRNRLVYAAIADLHSRNLPVDVVSVFEHLRDRKRDEKAGGLPYVNALAQCVPSAANAGRYADIVVDKATRRAILAAADQARELAASSGTTAEALDQVEALFAALRNRRGDESAHTIGELVAARIDHWTALQQGEAVSATPIGLAALDEALGGGVAPGRNLVVAARPSVGKTSFAWHVVAQVAKRNRPVLVLSMEMRAGELIDRAASAASAVPLDRISRGRLEGDDWSAIASAADRLRDLPILIDDRPALTLLDIRARARQAQQRFGDLGLVAVDYLQLATAVGNFGSRHHAIETISRGMKSLAKELNTTVLLLSQLTREAEGVEPELSHLKESGAIEEDADAVLLLHPMGQAPEGGSLVMVKVAKNRHGRRGRLGLAFDPRIQTWQTSAGNVSSRRGAEEGSSR